MTDAPQEPEVGISEFLRPDIGGFTGRFKERWQDFHVHEVDAEGHELHLSELLTAGAVAAELRQAAAERREARAALGPAFTPEDETEAELREKLGGGAYGDLLQFLRQQRPGRGGEGAPAEASSMPGGAGADAAAPDAASAAGGAAPAETQAAQPPPFVDFDAAKIGDGSKEARKTAHQTVLKFFGSFLNTETVEADGGVRTIRVWMREAEKKVKSLPDEKGREDKSAKGEKGGKGKGGKGKKGGKKGGKGKKGRDADSAQEVAAEGAGEFGTLRREGWPKDRPDYLYFRLYKENCNTSEAVASIARCVGRSAKQFSFAGTKDRRAVTVQWICAHKLPADQLRRSVCNRLWDKRIRISDMGYRPQRLRLGELRGNRFFIALRGVPDCAVAQVADGKSAVARAFAAVAEGGFLNYYGLQRFGTREIRTHAVGAALIARRWEQAIRLILGDVTAAAEGQAKRKHPPGGDGGEPPAKVARVEPTAPAAEAAAKPEAAAEESAAPGRRPMWQVVQEANRIYLETGDAQKALEAMPRSQHIERCLLGALARQLPPAEALRQLPHQAASLYVHAAQSIVWNACLSRRIREFGMKPVLGDLVLASKEEGAMTEALADVGDEAMDAELDDEEQAEDTGRFSLPAVRELSTAEEVAAADICDVVLPLPGTEVRYPPCLRTAYEEISKETLGLTLEDFHDSALVPLSGSYRRAVVRPADLKWDVVQPSAEQRKMRGTLLTSDVARLLAAKADGEASGGAPAEGRDGVDTEEAGAAPGAEDGAASPAVVFDCVLPPSAYLTMLLREVMKQSTASAPLSG